MWTLFSVIVVFVLSTGVQAQELREVPASDILEQIENGEDVAYENVKITGKLDLSKINLTTVPNTRSARDIEDYGLEKELNIVESNIEIRNSVFAEDVDFSNTEFRKDIVFSRTSFSSKNDFIGANFAGYAGFMAANFAGYADFMAANFAGDAYFRDTDFTGDALFGDANFARDADFGDANFTGDALFGDANFARDALFGDANFTGDASFWYANFTGYALFWDANFAGDARFGYANFAGDASFGDANFSGDADFGAANFAGDAGFGAANFSGDATFFSTKFDKVSFTGTTFTNVALIETDYNQMNVEWSTLKDALAFNGPAYIKLIKNFREMQHFENADAAYYQYRQLSQKNKKWSESSKLMDALTGLSCGYGVKPERPLIWGFLLIIVFALVYKQGKGIKRLKESDGDDSRVSFWDAFYFSVTTFTTVGYGDWYPIDRYRIVVMIEGVLGWLLLALFIVTLANVMIRP
jgi:hypothetical protein